VKEHWARRLHDACPEIEGAEEQIGTTRARSFDNLGKRGSSISAHPLLDQDRKQGGGEAKHRLSAHTVLTQTMEVVEEWEMVAESGDSFV